MSKQRLVFVLALVAVGLLSLFTAATAPTAANPVTLAVFRSFDAGRHLTVYRFTGAVSSGAAGETVTVMQQTCGYSFSTAVAGTETRSGGAWEVEAPNPSVIAMSATYRARWRNEQSDPVAIRAKIPIMLQPAPNRRLIANVLFWTVRQNMGGRIVLLERLRNKKWSTVRRQKLVYGAAGRGGYSAIFAVPRGWTVRARVPAQSAAPCFLPNTSVRVRTR